MNMQNQNTKQTSSQTSTPQKPVLPQVWYHPSIHAPGGGASARTSQTQRTRPKAADLPQTRADTKAVQKNQNTKQSSSQTSMPQKRVLPQVQYHPSIHVPQGQASARTTRKTRTSQTQRAGPGPAHPPQTRTITKTVQENQNIETRLPTRPGPEAAAVHPDPRHEEAHGDGAPPRPEQVPLDLRVHLDRCVVEKVEALTRGQRLNQDWFAWRKNRITASVAHCIAHSRFANGKSQTPPPSYLAAITGEGARIQTRAMSWGVQMEAEAVRQYQRLKSAVLGRQVQVRDCGLFIDAHRPWLAASPDGIVTDGPTGQSLLCLEVKCPFKHRHRRLEDACRDDPAFCLEVQDGQEPGQPPSYRLKTSHSYFTQIQCQLAVTGLTRAELVVFTLKETAIVPVTFDPELWEDTLSKLETFYRDAVLPQIRKKKEQDGAQSPEL